MTSWRVIEGDCRESLRGLDAGSVQTCVTSPPYFGLRDYGHDGQIGLEPTPDEFVEALVGVFREVRRVLRDDGTVWLNLGDSYNADGRKGRAHMGEGKNSGYSAWVNKTMNGTKPKDLLGIPWMVAFALRADGWYLRSDIIWSKPNPMPESVTDRPTKAHEYVFLLSKGPRYFYDADAVREPHDPANVEHHERYGQRPTSAAKNAVRRDSNVRRGALRDVPAEADRAVHPRRQP
jgi:DNA modification methylase